MSGAVALGQNLAGVVVAIMYAGGNLLEDIAVARAERDLRSLIDRRHGLLVAALRVAGAGDPVALCVVAYPLLQDLELHPAADGVGHCEIAGTQDTLEGYAQNLPRCLREFVRNWEEHVREITHDAPVHPTVRERFKFDFVVQCAGSGRYRPRALKDHDDFKRCYPVGEGHDHRP